MRVVFSVLIFFCFSSTGSYVGPHSELGLTDSPGSNTQQPSRLSFQNPSMRIHTQLNYVFLILITFWFIVCLRVCVFTDVEGGNGILTHLSIGSSCVHSCFAGWNCFPRSFTCIFQKLLNFKMRPLQLPQWGWKHERQDLLVLGHLGWGNGGCMRSTWPMVAVNLKCPPA